VHLGAFVWAQALYYPRQLVTAVTNNRMDNENGDAPAEKTEQDSSEEVARIQAAFADQQKRAEKAEAELKELKKLTINSKSEGDEQKPDANKRLDEFERDMQLRDQGYSTEEVRYLKTVLRGSGKPLEEILGDPFVTAAIKAKREEARAIANTVEPSFRTPSALYEGKTYAEVVTSHDSKPTDKQSAFEAQRDAILGRRHGASNII
jgi:hypothetical protein